MINSVRMKLNQCQNLEYILIFALCCVLLDESVQQNIFENKLRIIGALMFFIFHICL